VEYIQGDAYQLPFQENTFDGCQSSRVFKHLAEPGRVLAEMVRVARPGARVVVAEADFDLTIVDIPDRTLARKMIHLACDSVRQGWMGRQLPKLFSEVGLSDIVITGHVLSSDYAYFQMVFVGLLQDAKAAGKVSAEELTRFWDLLEQADRRSACSAMSASSWAGASPDIGSSLSPGYRKSRDDNLLTFCYIITSK